MVERAQIVLAAAEGLKGVEIAERVGCSEPTVVKWRGRYAERGIEGLKDAPRSGAPLTHGPETRALLIAKACTRPEPTAEGARRERWTYEELGAEVGMSASQAHVILSRAEIKPHRTDLRAVRRPAGAVSRGQPRRAQGRYLHRLRHRHAGRRQPGHHLHAARPRLCRGKTLGPATTSIPASSAAPSSTRSTLCPILGRPARPGRPRHDPRLLRRGPSRSAPRVRRWKDDRLRQACLPCRRRARDGRGRGRAHLLERIWSRPTCDINGIWGGYTGEGSKTVIAARASAKLSCRLVPDQDPAKVLAGLQRFFDERLPEGCRLSVIDHGHGPPSASPTESPWLEPPRRRPGGLRQAARPDRHGRLDPVAASAEAAAGPRLLLSASASTTTASTARTRSSSSPATSGASRPTPRCWASSRRSADRERARRLVRPRDGRAPLGPAAPQRAGRRQRWATRSMAPSSRSR